MPFRRNTWNWLALTWWLMVLAVALLLKYHYSIATAADLDWMLHPLSLLLEWLTGHDFHRDSQYEWVSISADVRLVKACAGINFMLMSLMAYAWIIRPDRYVDTDRLSWFAGQTLLLCAAIIASWITCLLANSLRIIVAMTVKSHGWDLDVIGIDATELHRLIGMAIYVPLLSMQMMLGNRSSLRAILAAPVLLYMLLMVMVPLLTGNALQHPKLFIEHLQQLLVMMVFLFGIYFVCRDRLPSVGSSVT
jgi:exosortase K